MHCRWTPNSRQRTSALAMYLFFSSLAFAFFCASTSAKAAPKKVRTIVLDLKARRGADADLAVVLSDIVQGEIGASGKRKVFSKADVERLMQYESDKAAMGCDDESCLAELASALDVDRVITGSIAKVGSKIYVVLSEFDSTNVEPLARVQKRLPVDEDELVNGVQILARKLLRESKKATDEAKREAKKGKTPKGTQENDPDDQKPEETGDDERTEKPSQENVESKAGEGRLVLNATPGATIEINGKDYGETPLDVALEAGVYNVYLQRDEKPDVVVELEILEKEKTKVSTRFDLPGGVPSREYNAYKQTKEDQSMAGWAKLGSAVGIYTLGSCLVTGVGLGLFGTQISPSIASVTLFLGPLCPAAVAAGVCGWGTVDLLFSPEAPPKSETLHEVEKREGTSDIKTYTIPDGAMAH
ncbi:MAG: PEGA domain-containing protein [Deltaproteobacteria bacterium]|nr:PEGA domain-containing protein [Deltaproteobacteria bacterium]